MRVITSRGLLLFVSAHRFSASALLLLVVGGVIFLILWRLPSLYGSRAYTLSFAGVERKYLLHLPRNYQADQQYPLVFVYHGYGNSPKLAEWYTGFSTKADKEGIIVVYPRGTSGKDPMLLSWNAGFCCEDAARNKVDDVGFTRALVQDLIQKYPIDPTRVYAAGFSNGAMMVHRLAIELPDVFAAIAPISGSIGGTGGDLVAFTMPKPLKPVPIVLIHGKKDAVVPFDGSPNRRGLFVPFPATVQFWTQTNQCTSDAQQESLASNVEKVVYLGCQNGSDITTYTVANGIHIWFGGNYDHLRHPFTKTINTTDAVWDFFSQHKKMGV